VGTGELSVECGVGPQCKEPCPADFDGDGFVGGGDLGLLLSAWGSRDGEFDLSGDGLVDGADMGLLLAAWGEC
jgi:hypothetical protein